MIVIGISSCPELLLFLHKLTIDAISLSVTGAKKKEFGGLIPRKVL
jgi:hypothetical protein